MVIGNILIMRKKFEAENQQRAWKKKKEEEELTQSKASENSYIQCRILCLVK